MTPPPSSGTTGTVVLDPLDGDGVPLDPGPTVLDPELLPLDTPLLPVPLEAPPLELVPDEADVPDDSFGPPAFGEGPALLEHAASTVPTTTLATTSHNFDFIGVLRPSETRPCRACRPSGGTSVHPGARARCVLVTRRNHRCKQLSPKAANIIWSREAIVVSQSICVGAGNRVWRGAGRVAEKPAGHSGEGRPRSGRAVSCIGNSSKMAVPEIGSIQSCDDNANCDNARPPALPRGHGTLTHTRPSSAK
jgi:hypothetical protein